MDNDNFRPANTASESNSGSRLIAAVIVLAIILLGAGSVYFGLIKI